MSSEIKTQFIDSLLSWHEENDRQLPWKINKDPYQIWLSEIILQQTRVAQGLPYYERFITTFPTVYDLAKADVSEVFKAWEGLGYYSRAKNLHYTAREIVSTFGGHFPNTYNGLLSLKGIGPYTAAAIASFAFDLPHAVLDGNVFRVLARVFGIELPIDQASGKQNFQKLAESLLPHQLASKFNQAIMDFGALQCVPQNPNCSQCPLQHICIAFQTGMVKNLPIKSKRLVKQNRYFHFFQVNDGDGIWLEKRSGKDIWQGLYQLPVIESMGPLLNEDEGGLNGIVTKDLIPIYSSKQQLTHRTIHGAFYQIGVSSLSLIPESWIKINTESLSEYPFPRIIHDYLKSREWLMLLKSASL